MYVLLFLQVHFRHLLKAPAVTSSTVILRAWMARGAAGTCCEQQLLLHWRHAQILQHLHNASTLLATHLI